MCAESFGLSRNRTDLRSRNHGGEPRGRCETLVAQLSMGGTGANADKEICPGLSLGVPGNEDISVDEVDDQLTEKQLGKTKVLGDEGEKEVRCQVCAERAVGNDRPHRFFESTVCAATASTVRKHL